MLALDEKLILKRHEKMLQQSFVDLSCSQKLLGKLMFQIRSRRADKTSASATWTDA